MNDGNMFSTYVAGTTKLNLTILALSSTIYSRAEERREGSLQTCSRNDTCSDSLRLLEGLSCFLLEVTQKEFVAMEAGRPKTVSTTHRLVEVHRYYSASYVDHMLTANEAEMKHNEKYMDEGVKFRLFDSPLPGMFPIYRYYRAPSHNHFYTCNDHEIGATKEGKYGKHSYKCQGVLGYAYREPVEGTIPLFRYYTQIANHFYTVDENEVDLLNDNEKTYNSEGVVAFVWA
ncbi:hypothetical protein AAMO2058_001717600 [Amorphochlora amoebiformis]